MGNRWDLPALGYGIGLRTVHFAEILERRPAIDFFEAITENFLDTGGRPRHVLDRVAERAPVVAPYGGRSPRELPIAERLPGPRARAVVRPGSDQQMRRVRAEAHNGSRIKRFCCRSANPVRDARAEAPASTGALRGGGGQ